LERRAHLLFSVECRRRLVPPIQQEYLGNCLRPSFVDVDLGELLGADGVVATTAAISASIKALDNGVLDGAPRGAQSDARPRCQPLVPSGKGAWLRKRGLRCHRAAGSGSGGGEEARAGTEQ
jgi:hypothetical protein